ncbi:NAD-dependent epimerase/dehydratase family protein [Sphingomonas sp. SAFR-052]
MLTGAGGFVGRYLVPALRSRMADDATLHFMDRTGSAPVDLLDPIGVHDLIERVRPDLVVHLAAQSSVGQSAGKAADTWRVNVGGTVNLAQAVATVSPECVFAFASSSEVYGAAFNHGTVTEETPPLPMSPYARSKRAAEDALSDILGENNRLILFRPANHSGAGQDTRFVLPAFAKQIACIEAGTIPPVIRVGSLTAERDFLDVHDVVDAYLRVLAAPVMARKTVFNIASGCPVPIGRLLEILLTLTTKGVTVEQDPARMRESEVFRTSIASDAIRNEVAWAPLITLEQTVADVLADCRTHRRKE